MSDFKPGLSPSHYAQFDNSGAAAKLLSAQPQRLLLIGQRLKSGAAAPNRLLRVTSRCQAASLFGEGSTLATMVEAAFTANEQVEAYAVALDDAPGAKKAASSFTFAGAPVDPERPLSGSLAVTVAGRSTRIAIPTRHAVRGERGEELAPLKPEDLAALVADAVNSKLPLVSARAGGATLRIEAKNAGEEGNFLAIQLEASLENGFEVTAEARLSEGKGNPSIEEALKALPETQFTQIACGVSDVANLRRLDEFLERRWEPELQIDGHGFAAASGSPQEIAAVYSEDPEDGAVILNSKHLTVVAASGSLSPPWVWAAALAAVNAKYAVAPSKPYQTLALPGLYAPAQQLSLKERNALLAGGISTFTVDAGRVRIDRLVTTYRQNPQGGVDPSYRDLNKKQTLSFLRFDFLNFIRATYPRHMLADDSSTQYAGEVATPKSARDLVIARHGAWKRLNLVQDPGGEFARGIRVEIDEQSGETMLFHLPVRLMGQLISTVTTVAFS